MKINRWARPYAGTAWQSYRRAWDHVEQRTLRGVPEAVRFAVLRTPEVEAVHSYMARLAYWGDVEKTQAAAQVWLAVVKQALKVQTRKEAA